MADVKSLIDDIIHNTDSSYPAGKGPVYDKNTVGAYHTSNNFHPQTFDKGKFREKLSLYVLRDIISAMMGDDASDMDEMVDNAIMRHIKNQYNGSCYDYLNRAGERLDSPLIRDIVQELDDYTDAKAEELELTKDDDGIDNEIDIDELLKDVANYDEYKKRLKDTVTDKVVNDVTKVIETRDDAPVFDNLDEELSSELGNAPTTKANEDTTTESVILKICGKIVTESYAHKEPITTDEGFNRAVVEYCIAQMDWLFKAEPKVCIFDEFGV